MKKIIVGFSRPKKWNILSYLIMKFQRTNYSHVYVKFRSESLNRDLIYQASGLQVNFVGSSLFYEHHIVVGEFELEISAEIYKKTLQFSVDKAGSPYSMKQLFNILLYTFTGKSILKDGRNAYICSELVGEILSDNFKIVIDKDLDIVTPKDIYKILSK